jgi:hypothetical protein
MGASARPLFRIFTDWLLRTAPLGAAMMVLKHLSGSLLAGPALGALSLFWLAKRRSPQSAPDGRSSGASPSEGKSPPIGCGLWGACYSSGAYFSPS